MESYEQKYKAALEWMKSLYGGLHGKTKEEAEKYFPELQDSEDERMKKAIMHILYENYTDAAVIEGVEIAEIVAWLENQGKPMWTDEDEERLQSCIISLQCKGLMGGVDTIDTKWLKSLKQRMEEQQ